MPSGKAADLQNSTCELLRFPAEEVHEALADGAPGQPRSTSGPGDAPRRQGYVFEPLLRCVAWVVRQITAANITPTTWPRVLQLCKLIPVPKSGQASEPNNRDMYRGISVSSIYSRVVDRLMHLRLDPTMESLGVRAVTQCGFRKEHGTIDALFTLTHLINRARHQRKKLYVVFIDFKKAFDTVPRDLLLARCRQLGIHGRFLSLLERLYDTIQLQVSVNGKLGDPIDTCLGTKQGSELSPLLFGLFIEMLHELITIRGKPVPGGASAPLGPKVGSLHVPDLLYADDGCLIAESPADAQCLLDCLQLFCEITGMEVNMQPKKTCVVVFRGKRVPRPRSTAFTYAGQPLSIQSSYTYLGAVLHETKGLQPAVDALAASGLKAMHTLLGRFRKQRITQYDMKCRMFDIMVEPVMSYASHVWGPELCHTGLFRRTGWRMSAADKVHVSFLRYMTGAGQRSSIDVLMRDLHRSPVQHHWVVLAARWWERLRAMPVDRLARVAWVSDVELALSGCKTCWTYYLLHTMQRLGVIQQAAWRGPGVTAASVCGLELHATAVSAALARLVKQGWADAGAEDADPRTAPSNHVTMCTHAAWVHPMEADAAFDRNTQPQYMQLCLPFRVLQCLARLRTGAAQLEVQLGRHARPRVPRQQRLCRLCSCANPVAASRAVWRTRVHARTGTYDNVEDLKHFLLECPAYDHLRGACPSVFYPAGTVDRYANELVPRILDCEDQEGLAVVVYQMWLYRSVLLGLSPDHQSVPIQPEGYVPVDDALDAVAPSP